MPDAPDNKRLVHRKDAEGKTQTGQTWETLIDRQIREAMEEGKFDDLPHRARRCRMTRTRTPATRLSRFTCSRTPASRRHGSRPARRSASSSRNATRSLRAFRQGRHRRRLRRRDHAALEELITQINVAVARVNAEAPATTIHAGRWFWPTSWRATTRPAAGRRRIDSGSGSELNNSRRSAAYAAAVRRLNVRMAWQFAHTSSRFANSARASPMLSAMGNLVGARGFELPTPASRTLCATRLRYAPTEELPRRVKKAPGGSGVYPRLPTPFRQAATGRIEAF